MKLHDAGFVVETERLILRRFKAEDALAMVTALNDAEMCRGLTVVPFPYASSDAHWFINEGAKDALAVCLPDDSLVGAVGLGKSLGYWIAKPHWGKGYATESATALIDMHFQTSDAAIMSSYVNDNFGSAKVLEKLGFEVVGDIMLPILSRGAGFPAKSVCLTKTRWETPA